jgi:hypothetical protein
VGRSSKPGGEEGGQVNLIVEPDDGIGPVVSAIRKAKTSIDIGIFRLDHAEKAEAKVEAKAEAKAA